MPFQKYISPIFGENNIQAWCEARPLNAKSPDGDATFKGKKGTIPIPWNNNLSNFSPSTASICELLTQLTLSKMEWIWNAIYQYLIDKAKSIITTMYV